MRRWIGISGLAVVAMLVGLWFTQSDRAALPVEPANRAAGLPDFTLPDLDDRQRTAAEWSGRPLIINFWATWCAPCRREMPLLEALHEERGQHGVQVIGVALDNREDARRFATEIGVTYPVLYGERDGALIAESIGGEDFVGLPFTAFVDVNGKIVASKSGELDEDELRLAVERIGADVQKASPDEPPPPGERPAG